MLGWIPFAIVQCPIEEVNNPRPEWLEARENNKQYIAHCIDDYQIGLCKKATNLASTLTFERTSICVDNIDDSTFSWVKAAVPCRECYRLWKESKSN